MSDVQVQVEDAQLPPRLAAEPVAADLRPLRTSPGVWLLEGRGFGWLRLAVDGSMATLAAVAAGSGAAAAGIAPDAGAALWALPPLVVAALFLRGQYKREAQPKALDAVVRTLGAVSVAVMILVAWHAITQPGAETGPLLARAWFYSLLFVGAGRGALVLTQRQARSRGLLAKPTLVVGAGVIGAQVVRRLEEHPEYGLRPIGYLDRDPSGELDAETRRVPILGTPDDLSWIVPASGAKHVIFAFSSAADRGLVPLVRRCEAQGLEVSLVPRLFESINDRMAIERLGGLPLLGLRSVDPKGWQFTAKYLFDRIAAAALLIVLAPLLAAIAAGVKWSSPGPVLFRQRRVGRDGQVFDLLKFRSMRIAGPADDVFFPGSGLAPGGVEGRDRRTRFGRWLRRLSLDELPQLVNVLRGEMSLIGPRPERPEFVELFRQDLERYADRHRVKSGITGWAQVHGLRGQTSLADRVEWDNAYIENWSLWMDCKILLLTLGVLFRSGDDW